MLDWILIKISTITNKRRAKKYWDKYNIKSEMFHLVKQRQIFHIDCLVKLEVGLFWGAQTRTQTKFFMQTFFSKNECWKKIIIFFCCNDYLFIKGELIFFLVVKFFFTKISLNKMSSFWLMKKKKLTF